jgi:hypothetical protein
MADDGGRPELDALDVLVGTWSMEADFNTGEPVEGGTASFEWMSGERFLVERWEVPVPEAPDGIAVLGWDESGGRMVQHYFDTRGVARVYEMSMQEGIWSLSRTEPDFSPLDFAQRYRGTFSEDGSRIDGEWQIRHPGSDWERDFGLNYIRVG